MKKPEYVAYYRVSTQKQGKSGLGLAAQEEAVQRYVAGVDGDVVESYTETESGRCDNRPELQQALKVCRLRKACLIVAKMDRLTRSVSFLLTLIDKADSGRGVVFCDLPTIPEGPTGKFLLTQMASVAELEAGLIAQRTRAALAAAKAKGKQLGRRNRDFGKYASDGGKAGSLVRNAKADERAADLHRYIKQIQGEGAESLREIADALNERGLLTPHGGEWSAVQVSRLLKRLGL